MCEYLKEELKSAVIRYGNVELLYVDNKHITKHWDRNTYEASIAIPQMSYFKLRSVLMLYGRILEEKTENSFYILSMSVREYPGNNAIVVIVYGEDKSYHIAAFAKELPILSHIAQTAVNTIVKSISNSI